MKSIIIAFKAFIIFTLLTGVVYPLLITGLSQVMFPGKANGSLIKSGNTIVGSELIGQQFDSLKYFYSRPSAINYNPLPSGASNFGLTNAKLKNLVYNRKNQFFAVNHLDSLTIVPSEMLFASASGLDPHISPEAAYLQAERIANARNFNSDQNQNLKQLIKDQIETPQLLCFGKERVNVLLLNLEVDKIK
jgi:potassium-transporting ATPase KdpC subunit